MEQVLLTKESEKEKKSSPKKKVQKEEEIKQITKKKAKFIQYQLLLEKYFQGISTTDFYKNLTAQSHLNYITELDKHFGDIILVFPNPDYPDIDSKAYATLKEDGIPFLNEGINFQIKNPTDQRKKKSFIRAFGKVFTGLSKVPQEQEKQIYEKQKVVLEKEEKELKNKKNQFSNKNKSAKIIKVYFNSIPQFFKILNKPKICYGGKFLDCDNQEPANWTRSPNQTTKDFVTLIRNTILLKLQNDGGYRIRQFLSSNGKKIFAVLYANQQNIERFAQELQFSHLVNPEFTDLLSFEPVDERYRPIRVNLIFRNENSSLITSGFHEKDREEVQNLIHSIQELLHITVGHERIDMFKRMCRNVRLEMEIDEKDEIIENQPLTLQVLKCYCKYLEFVRKQVDALNKEFNLQNNKPNNWELQQYGYEFEMHMLNKQNNNIFEKSKPHNSNLKKIKERRRQVLAYKYLLVMMQGIKIANDLMGKDILQTIWQRIKLTPKSAASSYFSAPKNMSDKNKARMTQLWKRYEVSQFGRNSIFNKMQIIKLTFFDISNHLNIGYLFENNFIEDYFFMNDYYELQGKDLKCFDSLIEQMSTEQKIALNQSQYKKEAQLDQLLNPNFQVMCKIQNSSKKQLEYWNFHKLQIKEEFSFQYRLFTRVAKTQKQQFVSRLVNLQKKWAFNCLQPWKIPLEYIRFYYGEKIALYYEFLAYYCKQLLLIGFFGIFIFLCEQVLNEGSTASIALYTFFSCIIQIWSSYVIYEWERKEKEFCLEFGYSEEKNIEPDRPSFKGTYKRSLASDEMNSIWSSSLSRGINYVYYAISYVILLAINIAASIILTKQIEILEDKIGKLYFIEPAVFIIAAANYLLVVILSKIQGFISEKLTNWENHQKVRQYENSYIIKIFLFQSINFAVPLFIIAFLNVGYPDNFDCAGYKCFELLKLYTRSFVYIIFLSNFFEIIIPAIKFKLKKSKQFEESQNQQNDLFFPINQMIEMESYKTNYNESEDIDGTISDYIELLLNFSFLTYFGIAFPLLFLSSFFLMALEIQVDKTKMINYIKRPFPKNASEIGIWKNLMEFASLLGILVNTSIITYTNDNYGDIEQRFVYFLLILILSYGIKFIMFIVYQRLPTNIEACSQRLKRVQNRAIFNSGKTMTKNVKPQMPIYKIWGTILTAMNVENESILKEN